MKSETHLLIVWLYATDHLDFILDDLAKSFEIREVFQIHWSDKFYSQNLTRFYGENLPDGSDKETHVGRGAFHAVVFEDTHPYYAVRDTTKGAVSVNINIFDKKQQYRQLTGGGHKIHATNSPEEFAHDIWLLLGQAPSAFEARDKWDGTIKTWSHDLVGAAGWNSIEELFNTLNNVCRYVVLRNFEPLPDKYHLEDHGDIDLLVDDVCLCVYATNATKVFPEQYRVHYYVNIAGQDVPFDFRYVGDQYYGKPLQKRILNQRHLIKGCFFAPSMELYFYTLLYHALIHKQELSKDYANRLSNLAGEIGIAFNGNPREGCKLLSRFLYKNGYDVTEPIDRSVYFNTKYARAISVARSPVPEQLDSILSSTQDLSLFSIELKCKCLNEDLLYHLSPQRANVLRPFHELICDVDVLEIGADCGALTRYLGENAKSVLALEEDPIRRALALARTRDLGNVELSSDSIDVINTNKKFAVITLIGSLEYADALTSEQNSPNYVLQRLHDLLLPNGILIIAVNNRLALTNFAGGIDPVSLEPMRSIEDRVDGWTRRTYGHQALRELVSSAGYTTQEFLVPFPNYTAPNTIITEHGLNHAKFDVSSLACLTARQSHNLPDQPNFALELSWPAIIENGLTLALANSFVVVASRNQHKPLGTATLGIHYSQDRIFTYCKEIHFIADKDTSDVLVCYRALGRTQPPGRAVAQISDSLTLEFNCPSRESYVHGHLLAREFIYLMVNDFWSVDDIAQFLRKYISILCIDNLHSDFLLPGSYFDRVPQNIIIRPSGQAEFIDTEWALLAPIELGYLLFRTISLMLGSITRFGKNRDNTQYTKEGFLNSVFERLGLQVSDQKLSGYISTEAAIQSHITGLPTSTFGDWNKQWILPSVTPYETRKQHQSLSQKTAHAEMQLSEATTHIELLKSDVEALKSELQATKEKSRSEIEDVNGKLRAIISSKSWKLTRPLRLIARVARYGVIDNDRKLFSEALRQYYHRLPLPAALKKYIRSFCHDLFRPFVKKVQHRVIPLAPFSAPTYLPATQEADTADYIVWGVIDWHFRHQRPQQLAKALAARKGRVFYISPSLIDDERAGFEVESLDSSERIFQIRLFTKGAPSIYMAAPDSATVTQLRHSIGELLIWSGSSASISLVDHPYWFEIASAIPSNRLIYDCMDHHEGFGNNGASLITLEQQLLENSELTITTSSWLDQSVASNTSRRALIRNAAEYEHFSVTPNEVYRDQEGRKVIGYYGAIADWFDVELVMEVAKQNSDCAVLLVGSDTINAKSTLAKNKNVSFIGEVPYAELPYYLYGFDVCLLPFKVIPLTLATNPVKAYEYLAAGKPIVTVDLPEMQQFRDLVYVEKDNTSFAERAREILSTPEHDSLIEARKNFARNQTWEHRASELSICLDRIELDSPLISVIIVTYNNLDLTKTCLSSVDIYSLYPNLEIIVVDNASSDGSPEYLSQWVKGGTNRRLILNDDNLGFAAANNQGLKLAQGEYLVLLNNDTHVTPGWVRTLAAHLQRDSSIGLIGPVTNNIGNESKIEISYADMQDMLSASSKYTKQHIGELFPLSTAAFFCVMMPRSTYMEVGLLDEEFGKGFFEDDDYCRRIEKLNKRIMCAEDVFIHHHLSASFKKLRSKERQELFEQNKAYYEKKWGTWQPHKYRR